MPARTVENINEGEVEGPPTTLVLGVKTLLIEKMIM